MAITFRKDQTSGQWRVFGPADEVRVGRLTASRKDGSTAVVEVERVSRPFDVEGRACAYGYIAPKAGTRWAGGSRRCWECGRMFTRQDAAECGGDWGESYCGC